MHLEVVYALPDRQRLIAVDLPEPVTVQQAIEGSGILAEFPEIDLTVNQVGVFAQVVRLDELLRDGDRVEIYRPLIADPKVMRRERAAKKAAAEKQAAGS